MGKSGIPAWKFERLPARAESEPGQPRHIGTHLGGLVISSEPLTCVTPLQRAAKGCAITQCDKDTVEDLGLIKLDLLSLRTLGAVEHAVDMVRGSGSGTRAATEPGFDFDRIPHGDRATYEMLNAGETIGVFQLESPAQRALQTRLGADSFEDIVASVALIRPGPIQGNMVEPFIVRRRGNAEISYVDPTLAPILDDTYGVVPYPEQVIQIATTIAGFTPGEADRLRRRRVRVAALALLGLAAGKVFLFDLTTLTPMARVGSFRGVGLLLLVGAFAYQRLRPEPLEPATPPRT